MGQVIKLPPAKAKVISDAAFREAISGAVRFMKGNQKPLLEIGVQDLERLAVMAGCDAAHLR